MKGRKLGAVGVAFALLIAVAVAAASVGAAGAATKANPTNYALGTGKHKTMSRIAVGTFKSGPSYGHQALPSKDAAKSLTQTNTTARIQAALNNLVNPSHVKKGNYKAAGAALAGPPNGPNLPFGGPGAAAYGQGTSAWLNEEVNGGISSIQPDPSPGLCEGAGMVMQVTEDTILIGDGVHPQNPESLYLFFQNNFSSAPFNGGGPIVLDHPHCYYDNGTKHWFVAVDAFDLSSGASAIMVAASVLNNPVGTWYFYNVDTSVTGDGSTCGGGLCYGNLRSLGANKNGIFLTTDEWSSSSILGFVPNQSPLFSGYGSSVWALDLTGLALGLPVGVTSWDVTNALGPYSYGVYATTSPNGNWNMAHGGTEFLLMADDPQGSLSNTIVVFAITGTSTISFVESGLVLSGTVVNGGLGMNTWFGLPVTDTNCSNVNLGYIVINTITCVDQPPFGAIPLGDFLGFGYGGIPRPLNAGDDSIAGGQAVTIPNKGPTTIAFVLTTKVVVQDSVHVNHLRAGTYYGFVHPSAWDADDDEILNATEDRSGIISNANNSFIFPSIGLSTNASNAVIVATLSGNAHFPSVVYSKVSKFHGGPSSVNIVSEGQAPYDGFFQYPMFFGGFPFALLFWGEYSTAFADGATVWFTAENVANPGCSDGAFLANPECGGTRSWGQNWTTIIGSVHA